MVTPLMFPLDEVLAGFLEDGAPPDAVEQVRLDARFEAVTRPDAAYVLAAMVARAYELLDVDAGDPVGRTTWCLAAAFARFLLAQDDA